MTATTGMEFFARCAGGFEDVLAGELRALRVRRVRPQVGGVIFFGTLLDAYRACLWLRCATRVQLVLARVPAMSADALYQGVRDLPWEEHVPPAATIAVDAHGENPELRNTRFVALKVKDAICDRLRDVRGSRPDVDAKDPDLAIDVAVHPAKATVYLNLSGTSLHRRGYRIDGVQTEAPLKETLAAGILLAADWPQIADAGGSLADPMCGSGTFAIEAGLIAAHIAPGLLRTRWGFEGWTHHDADLWERTCAEAQEGRRSPGGVRVVAGDLDPQAVALARGNAARAGVADLVHFYVDDAANLGRHLRALRGRRDAGGLLTANPPYGVRLGSQDDLAQVNAALAAAVEALPRGWRLALVTPDTSVDTALGRLPERSLACHNGPLAVWVRLYDTDAPRLVQQVTSLGGTTSVVPLAEPNSTQFAARLRKVAKERAKWARRAGVSCYRVYDADLPDYALSVDLYQDAVDGRGALLLEERRRPGSIDELRAERRLADAVVLSAAVLDVPADRVAVRPWQSSREENKGQNPRRLPLVAGEGGCRFAFDLGRRESILPLEQRGVRDLASTLAEGRRVAGLFATSGSALVRAAAAGARDTVVVDGAKDWLEGVRRAFGANDLAGRRYRFACADVRAWLRSEARVGRTYDVLVCVAPTWLPARDAGGSEWDLARDHVTLLRDASAVLAPEGELLLAFDGRDLRLDLAALEEAGLVAENVSGRVVPHDFERSRTAPRCFIIRKG